MTAAATAALARLGLPADLEASVASGLARVEEFLAAQVRHDHAFISEASGHLLHGGKRFRPMLAVLVAHLGDGVTDEVVAAASAVELIHMASLYHDDVMDEAEMRHGTASVNAAYDNSTAILVGDLLFGKASSIVADLGPEAVKIQADTFVRLCAGQIRDARPRPSDVDEKEYYLGVLADKTGALIATAAQYGAMFSHCDRGTQDRLRQYGERIGIAFQLADDLLDIASTESGKTRGTDLREGVHTLPVIDVKTAAAPGDARLLQLLGADLGSDDTAHAEALSLLAAHPAMERAAAQTRAVVAEADGLLEPLGEGPVVDALRRLAWGVVDRAV